MKGPLDRTKVVVRHLPPTILQSNFVEHVDSRFSERYRWLCFRPGKSSHKHLIYSRAYIEFNKAEDVIEFAEFFNGHVFVNEKGNVHYILEAIHLGLDASDQKHMSLYSGTQFKAIVEYAPSQRVPKQWSKKDGREGTILKDPEYLEFLDFLAKPVENLPSAEIQLERKEAERAGAPKDVPIITPLMDYVRQKRAAKGGARRTVLNGKSSRRVSGMSSRSPMSSASRRGSEKRRSSTTMYVMRDNSKGISSKEKSTYLLVPKQDDQQLAEKSVNVAALSESLEAENGSGSTEMGKKKILLLKGKEKEILNVSGGSLQQNATSPDKSAHGSAPIKNHHREASGRIIRSILLNRETHQNQPSSGSQSEPRILFSSQDREKKPPRPPSMQSLQKDANGVPEDKVVGNDSHAVHTEKQERRTRNKDRPDRVVWAPPRRSDGSHGSDESLSSSTSQTSQAMDSAGGNSEGKLLDCYRLVTQLEAEQDVVSRGGEYRRTGNGRNNYYSVDNGSFRHGSRRGSAYTVKDVDGSSVIEGKLSKRGSSGYGSHEKQVWVQKSSSGS